MALALDDLDPCLRSERRDDTTIIALGVANLTDFLPFNDCSTFFQLVCYLGSPLPRLNLSARLSVRIQSVCQKSVTNRSVPHTASLTLCHSVSFGEIRSKMPRIELSCIRSPPVVLSLTVLVFLALATVVPFVKAGLPCEDLLDQTLAAYDKCWGSKGEYPNFNPDWKGSNENGYGGDSCCECRYGWFTLNNNYDKCRGKTPSKTFSKLEADCNAGKMCVVPGQKTSQASATKSASPEPTSNSGYTLACSKKRAGCTAEDTISGMEDANAKQDFGNDGSGFSSSSPSSSRLSAAGLKLDQVLSSGKSLKNVVKGSVTWAKNVVKSIYEYAQPLLHLHVIKKIGDASLNLGTSIEIGVGIEKLEVGTAD